MSRALEVAVPAPEGPGGPDAATAADSRPAHEATDGFRDPFVDDGGPHAGFEGPLKLTDNVTERGGKGLWLGEISGNVVVARLFSDYPNVDLPGLPGAEPQRRAASYEAIAAMGHPVRTPWVGVRETQYGPVLAEERLYGKQEPGQAHRPLAELGVQLEDLPDEFVHACALADLATGELNRNPYNIAATEHGPAARYDGLAWPERGAPYRVVDNDAVRVAAERGIVLLTPEDRQSLNSLVTSSSVREGLGLLLPAEAISEMDGRVGHMLDKGRLLTPEEFAGRAWETKRGGWFRS